MERVYGEDPDTVFGALKRVCNEPPLTVQGVEKNIKRMHVSAGASAFSWGESLEVQVYPHKKGSLVHIEGKAKAIFNISADPGRHIREIIRRLDEVLNG